MFWGICVTEGKYRVFPKMTFYSLNIDDRHVVLKITKIYYKNMYYKKDTFIHSCMHVCTACHKNIDIGVCSLNIDHEHVVL